MLLLDNSTEQQNQSDSDDSFPFPLSHSSSSGAIDLFITGATHTLLELQPANAQERLLDLSGDKPAYTPQLKPQVALLQASQSLHATLLVRALAESVSKKQ